MTTQEFQSLCEIRDYFTKNKVRDDWQQALDAVYQLLKKSDEMDEAAGTTRPEGTRLAFVHERKERQLQMAHSRIRSFLGLNDEDYEMLCFEQWLEFCAAHGIASRFAGRLYEQQDVREWFNLVLIRGLQASLYEEILPAGENEVKMYQHATGTWERFKLWEFAGQYRSCFVQVFQRCGELPACVGSVLVGFAEKYL